MVQFNGHLVTESDESSQTPVVNIIADLGRLKRWIPVDKKLAGTADFLINGRSGRSVFSHPNPSKCGGFENGISAEQFVREGGVCLDHRLSKSGRTVERQESIGWFTRDELSARENRAVSFCFGFSDCPPLVIADISMPASKDVEELARQQAEALPHRDAAVDWLRAMGCPVGQNGSPVNGQALFMATNPAHYGGRKHVWQHETGLKIELHTPGSADHTPIYGLEGALPELDPAAFDEWLEQAGFEHTQPAPRAGKRERGEGSKSLDYFHYGEEFGRSIAAGWCYDPRNGGLHEWDGQRWRLHADTRHGHDVLWRLVMHAEEDEGVRILLQGRGRAEVLRGIESAVERALPRLGRGFVAAANGVVNLQTGELRDFDPVIDGHRAITGGAYHQEWSDERCMAVLFGRFHPGGRQLLDFESISLLADFAGLALTGEAQRHTSILHLWGRSGGGKGGCLNLFAAAFGDRAKGVGADVLKGTGSEIDATWVELLTNDVLVVTVPETDAVNQAKLLADTGDNDKTHRVPHGKPVTGRLRAMFIVSGVDPPPMDLFSGFKRRIGVIKLPEHPDVEPGENVIQPGFKADPTQDEADALITLAVRRAAAVYREDYQPPTGNPAALAEFHEVVDPLSSWLVALHRTGQLQGLTVKALCDAFTDAEGLRFTIRPKTIREKCGSSIMSSGQRNGLGTAMGCSSTPKIFRSMSIFLTGSKGRRPAFEKS